MNMRATLDPYNSYCGPGHNAALVDKAFGSAYDVVRSVAEGMSFVKHVSYHMEDIFELSKVAGAISVLAKVADDIASLGAVVAPNPTGTQEATTVMVSGDLSKGVADGDLQAAFMALAARVQALENAAP